MTVRTLDQGIFIYFVRRRLGLAVGVESRRVGFSFCLNLGPYSTRPVID